MTGRGRLLIRIRSLRRRTLPLRLASLSLLPALLRLGALTLRRSPLVRLTTLGIGRSSRRSSLSLLPLLLTLPLLATLILRLATTRVGGGAGSGPGLRVEIHFALDGRKLEER